MLIAAVQSVTAYGLKATWRHMLKPTADEARYRQARDTSRFAIATFKLAQSVAKLKWTPNLGPRLRFF
jgi:hypothetical protein